MTWIAVAVGFVLVLLLLLSHGLRNVTNRHGFAAFVLPLAAIGLTPDGGSTWYLPRVVGLRRAVAPAAIVGFSGALPGPEKLPAEIAHRPPVLLVHGDADEMIPVQALHMAANGLGAAGVAVRWHVSRGVGHGIAPDGLELAGQFLVDAFAGKLNLRPESAPIGVKTPG